MCKGHREFEVYGPVGGQVNRMKGGDSEEHTEAAHPCPKDLLGIPHPHAQKIGPSNPGIAMVFWQAPRRHHQVVVRYGQSCISHMSQLNTTLLKQR